MAMNLHPLLTSIAEEMSEPGGDLRALRLIRRQKYEQMRIAATEPRHELSIAQDHFGVGCARQDTRRRLRVILAHRQIRPAQDRTIGIRWIGGSKLHELRLLRRRIGPQLAQKIDGRRQGKLRRAKSGHEIASANAA